MKQSSFIFSLLLSLAIMVTVGIFSLSGQDLADGAASGTTGGQGGQVVTVNSLSDLQTYADSSSPFIILINGTIASSSFVEIDVSSNKTIVGLGTSATLSNIELHIIDQQNIIIRNLTIKDSYLASDPNGDDNDYDAIQVDNTKNLWLDHLHLTHCGDGLIDLRKACDNVTVSYVHFSDHNKTFGVGWTDETNWEKTIHHCWFDGTNQRNPSFDQGKGHLYNNYLSGNTSYGNLARGNARVIVQNSLFDDVKDPLKISDNGLIYSSGNSFNNCTGSQSGNTSSMPWTPDYSYSLDDVSGLKTLLLNETGPQSYISDQYLVTGGGFDPYSTMEAENYTAQSGIQTEACSEGGLNVGWVENGDWIRYNDVDFGSGANGFSARVASNATEGTITLRIDGMSGTPIGSCSVSSTGGWQSWTTASGSASGVSGVHDLYLMFSGGSGYLLNLNHFVFTEGSPSTTYTLASTVNGQGSISPSSGTYADGDVVSIVATPVLGWQFDGWGGDANGTSNPLSLTINANKSITANFSESSLTNSLTIQENQTGFCSIDGTIDANNGGFTGDGFANTANATGEGITWSVNAPSTGTYALIWRFANGDSTNRTAQAMINGSTQVANVDFAATSSWTSWAETLSINVNLAAGTNAVRLQATNVSGLANIDYIDIAGNAPTAAACVVPELRSAVVVKAIAASNADFGLMLYPNPCNELLTIELNEEMSEGAVIRLYDNVGRVIVMKEINEAKSSLDIGELQSGIYFVNVFNAKSSVVKRVLKK